MKHFKFNAITALIIGFSASVANAGLNSEVGNSNTVHSTESSTAFGQGYD